MSQTWLRPADRNRWDHLYIVNVMFRCTLIHCLFCYVHSTDLSCWQQQFFSWNSIHCPSYIVLLQSPEIRNLHQYPLCRRITCSIWLPSTMVSIAYINMTRNTIVVIVIFNISENRWKQHFNSYIDWNTIFLEF